MGEKPSGVRVLVCGSRNWSKKRTIEKVLSRLNVQTVIEGEASGADTLAKEVAEENGIPVEGFPAKWDKYGRRAGPIRNQRMIDEGAPDLVLAFHEDFFNSKGTRDMVKKARNAGLPVRIYLEDQEGVEVQ